MSRRGENIYKRRDGRWEGRYIREYDFAGKARLGYVYGRTYREVKEKLCAVKAAPSSGRSAGKTFSSYCEEWLTLRRSCIRESTYVKYYGIVCNHLKPAMGKLPLQCINTLLLEEFSYKLLKEKKLSVKTVKDILIVLQSVLQYISKQTGGCLSDVEVIYPKESKKEIRVLSPEEQARLIAYLTADIDSVKFGILLALLTGMRIGEVCALRWGEICLEPGEIRVTATLQRLQIPGTFGERKTRVVVGDAKSYASCRKIPLTGAALQLCRNMQVGNPDAFVLTGRPDRYMEPRALQYRLRKYTQGCGLSDVHFHSLRHTFSTRCVEVGFEIKSLSEILGHASAKITLDRYVHSSMELKRKNMQKLSAVGM